MNTIWTSDKTQLGVDTLKAMLVTMVNYDEICAELFKMLSQRKISLRKYTILKNTAALLLIFKVRMTTVPAYFYCT
jgi:hypothetical protein